ncbi:AAA family ATPase [Novosphingobium sp. PS1R-30]|uniref:AAA family ATPase n=1 Tax=Novosphingobium anseongense TaxID=3133436 RepID=A0ABU8S1C0_9SPHN
MVRDEVSRITRLVVVSGCSGGGKSTLLAELEQRGSGIVEEPGRRVIARERMNKGRALPWVDLVAFARKALDMARRDRSWALRASGLVFFDRGLVDAAAALEHATGEAALQRVADERYNRRVFLVPPWREIFENDADRRHGYDEAVEEIERLKDAYDKLGYETLTVPRLPVTDRADFIRARLLAN